MNSALGFGQAAEFSIDKPVHRFGKVKEGAQLTHNFQITNTGTIPLIISDYSVQCTCTKAFLPKKPIAPGESFDLKITFDTNGKYYYQDRIINLKANTAKGTHKIRFKVYVHPDEGS